MFSSEVFCWSGSGGFFGGLKIRLTPPWVEAKCVVEDDIGKYEVENKTYLKRSVCLVVGYKDIFCFFSQFVLVKCLPDTPVVSQPERK